MASRDPSPIRPFVTAPSVPAIAPSTAVERAQEVRLSVPLPSGPYPLHLKSPAIRDLSAFLTEPGGIPYGLLIGRTGADGVTVEDSVRRRLPPGTRLDQAGNIQAAVFQLLDGLTRDSAADSVRPVGLFRAQQGGRPVLTEQDCHLALRCAPWLPRGGAIFLVIRTFSQQPRTAAVFVLDEKPVPASVPCLEFPLDEHLLRSGSVTALAPAVPPVVAPAPALPPPLPERTRNLRWGAILFILAVLAGVGISALTGVVLRWGNGRQNSTAGPVRPAATTTPETFGFRASRTGKDVDLSWDRFSPAILSSNSGTLAIRDGDASRIVPLSAAQLREGHILYQASSGSDLDFRMEVLGANDYKRVESIQIIGFGTSPSAVAVSKPPAPKRVESAPDAAERVTRTSEPPAGASNNPSEHAAPSSSAPAPTPESHAAEQPPAPARDIAAAKPATPAQASPSAPGQTGPTQQAAAAPPPSPQLPAQTQAAQQQAAIPQPAVSKPSVQPPVLQRSQVPSQLSTPSGAEPNPPAETTSPNAGPTNYVGPVAIHKVNPILNRDAVEELRGTRGPVTVAVRLRIDEKGQVRGADPVSPTSDLKGGGFYLRVASTSAARGWRFQPATIGGKPVPSEMVITFSFKN